MYYIILSLFVIIIYNILSVISKMMFRENDVYIALYDDSSYHHATYIGIKWHKNCLCKSLHKKEY